MPAMNGKTYRYFIDKNTATGKKKFPYLNIVNMYPPVDTIADLPATYNAATDPKFILNPENIDSIKAFLIGRWQSGANVNWAFDINSDIQQLWPMSEDLSFTNATFKTAGMAGFPLGDLNHWWPTKYTAWLTQAPTERATILNMLTTGTVGVNDQNQPAIPLNYELGQNYPNPFNPTTTIEFRLPIQSNLRLALLNVLGQEVKVITTGTFSAGNHRVMLDASSLASGVYFYKLQTEKFSDVKKLMLIK
jgi:hypothetical protein